MVDLGEHFVRATYNLEGDGPLVVDCFEAIAHLRAVIHSSCSDSPVQSTSSYTAAMVYLCYELCSTRYSVLSGEIWK